VLLLRFANDLEDLGKVEMMPVLEGKRMTIMLTPLKAAAPKKEEKKGDRKDQKPAVEAAEAETEAGE
jgi:translation initiation factor IF-3